MKNAILGEYGPRSAFEPNCMSEDDTVAMLVAQAKKAAETGQFEVIDPFAPVAPPPGIPPVPPSILKRRR
jgi:hypothetical protein